MPKGHGEGSAAGQFKPGQSGNPGGRKRDRELTELCRTFTEDAVQTLAKMMHDETQPGATRVKAAEVLLDRGWGKARQAVEHTGADGEPLSLKVVFVEPGNTGAVS